MREKIENGEHIDIERFLEDLKLVLHDGQELLRAGVGRLKQQARFGAEKTDLFARERPYQTIGIAFGVGILARLLTAGMLTSSNAEDED